MTPSETTAIANRVLQEARALLAQQDCPYTALQAIRHIAWQDQPAVSVRVSNRTRWAIKALSTCVKSSDVFEWDRDETIVRSEVLAAFDCAIQTTAV